MQIPALLTLSLLVSGGALAAENESGQQAPKEPDIKECMVDSGGFRI
jgi:hypothetical protein